MSDDRLPRFRKAPVAEVAFGVQFQAPVLSAPHLLQYFDRLKARFPKIQFQPPLPPAFETFGPASPLVLPIVPFLFGSFQGMAGPQMPSPRMWISSADDSMLIQLQQDRLHFNWRAGANLERPYPHYDALHAEFERALDELEALVKAEGLAALAANQCDLLYVNPIPSSRTGIPTSEPHRVFRTWRDQVGEEWRESLEDLSFIARYRLVDRDGNPFGRLTAALGSGWAPDNSTTFQLEMLARGRPLEEGRAGIAAFHDEGHRAIVRCFAAITTPEMHKLWERYQ